MTDGSHMLVHIKKRCEGGWKSEYATHSEHPVGDAPDASASNAAVGLMSSIGGSIGATGCFQRNPMQRNQRNDVATAGLIENWIVETERRSWFLTDIGRAQ